MNKTAVVLIVLLVIAVISAAGYFGFATSKTPEPTATPQTVAATKCDVKQTVTAPGDLVNINETDVKMTATGKLSGVKARVGDMVKAGETLAELDPVTTTQAQVDLLEAQQDLDKLQKQRTALDYPRATDDFIKDLLKQVRAAKDSIKHLDSSYKNVSDPTPMAKVKIDLSNKQTFAAKMRG